MDGNRKSAMERGLKWVGAITAVLSLLFALQRLTQLITENRERERQISEFKGIALLQQNAGDYAPAWESLNSAFKLAESGGTLAKLVGDVDAETLGLRVAREDLAMAWLDDISKPSDKKFSDIVDKLQPVLEQGSLNASPRRKADLIAHVGWGYFLRGRDGAIAPDPQRQYGQALELDAGNPYALAYSGHWLTWNGGDIGVATERFAAALRANRAKELVRRLQLSAYGNRQSDGDVAYTATVGEMLKNDETVPAEAQRRALWHIDRACTGRGTNELRVALKQAISAQDLLAEYRSLRAASRNRIPDEAAGKTEACIAESTP